MAASSERGEAFPGELRGSTGTALVPGIGAVAAMSSIDGSLDRATTGWLRIGGERVFSAPGACTQE